MTTQTTIDERGTLGRLALFGATAMTMVALGGVALVGLRPGGDSAGHSPISTTTRTTEDVMPKGGLAELYDEQQRARSAAKAALAAPASDQEMYHAWQHRTPSASRTVYLVESIARQQALAELGLGADEQIVAVTTDADAAQVRREHGRPGVSVVDLRQPAGVRDGEPNGGASVLYLVSSQEQADWLRRAVAERDQIAGRASQVEVLVLPLTTDAAEFAGLPLAPGTRLFDLRLP